MHEITIITDNKKETSLLLKKCRFKSLRFRTLKEVKRLCSPPECLLIHFNDIKEEHIKDIIKTFHEIPKVIISNNRLKQYDPLTEFISAPSCTEIRIALKRLQEIKNLKQQTQQLQTTLQQELRFKNMLSSVTELMNKHSDLNGILNELMEILKTETGAKHWHLLLKDEETGQLVLTLSSRKSILKEGIRLAPGEGIAGWVAEKNRAVIVTDVTSDRRFQKEKHLHRYFTTTDLICFPLTGKEGLIGVFELINKKKGPFSEDDLRFLEAIAQQLNIAVEVTLLRQKLEEMAITDDLTKLFNTRYLNRTLEVEVERAGRYNTSVSLIFMDIDYFKDINDRYGHLVGSKVLAEVAQLLLKKLRSVDIVARYGGDEFVIVLPMTSPKYAIQVAERLRKAIAEAVFLKDTHNIKVTASFGVASYPENARSKEELLRLADEAMYKVKYRTRNGVYAINSDSIKEYCKS